jgi:hypothetical protein
MHSEERVEHTAGSRGMSTISQLGMIRLIQ